MSNPTVTPFPEPSKEQTIGDYRLVMSRVDHMIPHVPTLEMVKLHPWHVYKGDILCYTAPKEECLQWITRVSQKSETQSRCDLPTSSECRVHVAYTVDHAPNENRIQLAPNEVQIGNSIMRFESDCEPEVRERAIAEFKQSIEKEKRRQQLWPGTIQQKMSKLASLFPTMRGVPGTDPWDVDLLIKWMNGPAPTSGSWNAAMFLLGVWSPTQNWKECGLKMKKGKQGRFDFFRAFSCWDEQHERAFRTWMQNPFWP